MNETKHTPGPWDKFGPYEKGGFLDGGYLIVTGYAVTPPDPDVGLTDPRANLHGPNHGFLEADAKLIAAAPELLEALTNLHRIIEFQIHPPESNPIRFALDRALEALAKAT